MSGKVITVEGVEGVGKSTCIQTIVGCAERAGLEVVQTREPGGSPNAERIREHLLSRETSGLPDLAELLLMFAARCDHIENTIRPALDRGCWVVSDRFTDSSFAYQGGGRGIDAGVIETLESWVVAGLRVDRTFLLDLPPATGRERLGARELDRIEQEDAAFFNRTRDSFLSRARRDPRRFVVVDASQTPEAVNAELEHHMRDLLADPA